MHHRHEPQHARGPLPVAHPVALRSGSKGLSKAKRLMTFNKAGRSTLCHGLPSDQRRDRSLKSGERQHDSVAELFRYQPGVSTAPAGPTNNDHKLMIIITKRF